MTVIAFDGKVLASDKLASNGSTKNTVTKIFRYGSQLLAIAGNLSVGMEVMEWFKAGAVHKDYPASNRKYDEGASLIVIDAERKVWKYESSPLPFQIEGRHQAFGSGEEGALIAMHLGATAVEAVEAVIHFNSGCGRGVDVLELEP